MAHAASGPSRLAPIDAARGTAMLLSCLVHFAWWVDPAFPAVGQKLTVIGMIATPTFLLISGAMLGLVYTRKQADAGDVRNTFFNRGLFVLIFGHFGIALAEAHRDGGFLHAFPGTFTTDAIGLASMLAATCIGPNLLRARTLMYAAAAFVFAWLCVLYWHPASTALVAVKQLLFGREPIDREVIGYTSPFVQYIAIVAAGIPLGHMLARQGTTEPGMRRAGGTLLRIGAAFVAVGVLSHIAKLAMLTRPDPPPELLTTLTVLKIPPSPAYLLIYGGAGLMMTGSLLLCSRWKLVATYIEWAAVIGRASLFIYVFQYFTLWTLPDLLGIKPGPSAPLVFAANIALIWFVARCWLAFDGNRLMTFGIRVAHARWQTIR